MKIYLDTCCLNRPFDDQTQPRVALESQAILSILAKCESGVFSLISSEVVKIENDRNPFPEKKAFVESVIGISASFVTVDDACVARAIELESRGFKSYDALHISIAEIAVVDYFCSCDDRLLSRAAVQTDLGVKVRSPLALAQEIFT